MEVNANQRDACVGLRFDVLDVVDRRGHGAFEDGDDTLLHLLGRNAVVVPNDTDDRDIDVGEDIDRHRDDGGHSEKEYGKTHHDERVGAPKRKPDYPHTVGAIRM